MTRGGTATERFQSEHDETGSAMSPLTEREHRRRQGLRGLILAGLIVAGLFASILAQWGLSGLWCWADLTLQRWRYLERFENQYDNLIACLESNAAQATQLDYETLCEPCRAMVDAMGARAPLVTTVWFELTKRRQQGRSLLPLDQTGGTPSCDAVPEPGEVLLRKWDYLGEAALEYMKRFEIQPDRVQGYSILVRRSDLQ
jgi:hypothetical protein